MRTYSTNNKRAPKAQALVEFALAIPIVLVLVVGMLEVGRLIAYYSAVNSASREAARHGAATGLDSGVYRYCQVDEIRAKAKDAGFFAGVQGNATDVIIEYDTGPGTAKYDPCATGKLANGTRIVVTVKVTYVPVVSFPSSNVTRTVQSTSARTVMSVVNVSGAPTLPLPTWPPTPTPKKPTATSAPATAGPSPIPSNTPDVVPFTPAPTSAVCTLGHTSIDFNNNTRNTWDLINHYTKTVGISKIEVYSNISGQKVQAIALGGVTIYNTSTATPALITSGWSGSTANRSLTAGQTLTMTLDMSAKDQAGSLQIKVTFDVGGCTLLDSNLFQP